jgi:hypothetical protein
VPKPVLHSTADIYGGGDGERLMGEVLEAVGILDVAIAGLG